MVFLKKLFENVNFEKKSAVDKFFEKLPSMQISLEAVVYFYQGKKTLSKNIVPQITLIQDSIPTFLYFLACMLGIFYVFFSKNTFSNTICVSNS